MHWAINLLSSYAPQCGGAGGLIRTPRRAVMFPQGSSHTTSSPSNSTTSPSAGSCSCRTRVGPDQGQEHVVHDPHQGPFRRRGAGQEQLVAEQGGGQRSDPILHVGPGLAAVGGALEDGLHDLGADG